jgi:hypothetical protein
VTGAWSRPPVDRIVELSELGALGENLGENNGESRRVCRILKHPNWILKEYVGIIPPSDAARLRLLIELPEKMDQVDLALVDGHTSWPAARVVNANQETIGVLIPRAPETFSSTRRLPSGRTLRKPLEVDVLALSPDRQTHASVPPQSLEDRISVCASIASVGALFERWRLVYLDWSYANVFWSCTEHTAYVIDLDGCSFGSRPQVQSPNWEDPLSPRGRLAGNEVDRYRLALMTARCLTGIRGDLTETRDGLLELRRQDDPTSRVAELLITSLSANTTSERPSIMELSEALDRAAGHYYHVLGPLAPNAGGVKIWKPIRNRKPFASPPLSPVSPPAAPGLPSGVPTVIGAAANMSATAGASVPPAAPSSNRVVAAVLAAILIAILIVVVLIAVLLNAL